MKDSDAGNPPLHVPVDPLPRYFRFLAPTPQGVAPAATHRAAEGVQGVSIARDRMIVEVNLDDGPDPLPLFGERVVPAAQLFCADLLQLASQTFPLCLPPDRKTAFAAFRTDVAKAQEGKGIRLFCPRRRFSLALRPNSISRVFSGCSCNPLC